tara:strand:+ start:1108 stop:1986 length:879 start_codon:yes stop_codon:yes gene_type:complete
MAKTIYEKIKMASSSVSPMKSNHDDWQATDEEIQDSAGNILMNAEKRTVGGSDEVTGYSGNTMKLNTEQSEWRKKEIERLGGVQEYRDHYKIGTQKVITPAVEGTTEYRGDLGGEDPVDPTPERKRYNPGYFETLNKNLAEGAARRGSARDTKRAIKDLKGDMSKNERKALREKKRELRKAGTLKGRGSSRDIQLMQETGISGAENFGVTNVEAARGKLDKTTDSFKSRVEGQTMDKSAGQLGNVQDKVVMEKAKKGKPGKEGKENISGTPTKKLKSKAPFKMMGFGSKIKK